MFNICDGKGFQITLANGWAVSVQFGAGNYCENRSYGYNIPEFGSSPDAEIAAWDANNNWHDFGSDQVKGWCSADEVVAFLAEVAAFPPSIK